MNGKLSLKEWGKDPLYKIWHSGSEALIMYVYSGSGSIVTKDRNDPLEQNGLILIPPGVYHYTMPVDPEYYCRSKLFLPVSLYAELISFLRPYADFGGSVVFARIPPENQSVIDSIFTEAATCKADDRDTPLFLSCAMRLLHYLNRYASKDPVAVMGVMSKAIQYINENIAQELDLDSICSAINISKYYFCRQFKQQLGITVMQYILSTRIILARDELEKNNLSVSEISAKYGFSSVSYFCQAFKTETGYTPLQYRKMQRNC